jgi:hypothetical protein
VPQTTQGRISEKIKCTLDSGALPFHEVLDADMVKSALEAEGVEFKHRIYTPFVTFCLFLSQVLERDQSCRAAAQWLILWPALNGPKPRSSETAGNCEAHIRLRLTVIARLVHQTAEKVEASASEDWLGTGLRLSLVEGTTCSMPDTPRNQKALPRSTSRGVGLEFAVVRIVVIIALASGRVRDLGSGPYKGKETREKALFRTRLDRLKRKAGKRTKQYRSALAGLRRPPCRRWIYLNSQSRSAPIFRPLSALSKAFRAGSPSRPGSA